MLWFDEKSISNVLIGTSVQKFREITQKIFTHGTIQALFEQTWKDIPEFLELP